MTIFLRRFILVLIGVFVSGYWTNSALAQTNSGTSYIPLIGITSVPEPLALPKGAGDVIYNYAVKNFLKEAPLINVLVVDDKCSPVEFLNGDDNGDSKLDYDETWRYVCFAKLSKTTQNAATVTGVANNLTAIHEAYSTVIVGSDNPAPLVSIINVTKVAYPLSLPVEGGSITFTYKVNNPGMVPLSDVTVVDDKCSTMSSKLGDTNNNNLLDIYEVWIYTCTANLKQTTINTVDVTAFANGLKAVGSATLIVRVDHSIPYFPDSNIPNLPETGAININFKIIIWGTLFGILMGLTIFFVLTKKVKFYKK